MFCWSLCLFYCTAALGIYFFILNLTLVSIFLCIQFSCKTLNFFTPSPISQIHGARDICTRKLETERLLQRKIVTR